MIVVVIVPSGFRDRMHCASLQFVIAHPICPPALDSEVMIPHVGFCGRWPIGLSSSFVELGKGGFGARSQFSRRSSCSYFCSVFRAVDRGIVETMIPGGRERENKDLDTHPYRGRMGRAKAGIVESTIPPSWIAGLMK